jgi:hypothetical protein
MNESTLRARVAQLIALCEPDDKVNWLVRGNEVFQGTLTVLASLYGPESTQVENYRESYQRVYDAERSGDGGWRARVATPVVRGTLENVRGELEAGFLGDLRKQIAGAVLTDFVQLARAVLDDPDDAATNVAAVLAAAAFEDVVRRMGRELLGRVGHDDLSDVLTALKTAGLIQSPQLGIAQSYLSFRNHALHANWDRIERESVHSVLGFVEQLLMKHFG